MHFFLDDHYFCEPTSIYLEDTLYGFTYFPDKVETKDKKDFFAFLNS